MPALLVWIGSLLVAALPFIITRVLISLGIGVVSYIGMGFVLDFLFGKLTAAVNGLPLDVLQLAGLIGLDDAINIIFGSVNARLGFISLNGIVSRFEIDPSKYQA